MTDASPSSSRPITPAPAATAQRSAQHPLFEAPENDIVLLSADGVRLGYRRVFLEAASDVFESMGLIALESGASCETAEAIAMAIDVDDDDVPVVPLAEDAADLATFLRFLHPGEPDPVIDKYDELERLCFVADKYGVIAVARAALEQNGIYFVRTFSPEILGLALFFRLPALVVTTLRSNDFCCEELEPPCVVDDIPWRILRLLPPSTFIRLAVEHARYSEEWSSVCFALQNTRRWFEQGDEGIQAIFEDHREFTVRLRKDEAEREKKRKAKASEDAVAASASVTDTAVSDSPPSSPPSSPPPTPPIPPASSLQTVFSDGASDISVRAGDAEFRASRALLAVHSDDLRERLSPINGSTSALRKRTRNGRLILELDEPAPVVQRLLAFIHPQAAKPTIASYEELEDVCLTAEKLSLPVVAADALSLSGAHWIESHAPEILALALIFDVRPLASLALHAFDNPKGRSPAHGCYGPCCNNQRPIWGPFDIPWRLVRRLPFAAFIRLLRCHTTIHRFDARYDSWSTVAREIEQDPNWVSDAAAFLETFDANSFLLR